MAFWYVGSVEWTAVTAWAATTSQAAGVLRRQLATPTVGNERVFVCIIAGTTLAVEPTWVITKGAKTAEAAGPTWQECTGQPGVNGDLTNCPKWASIKNTAVALGAVIQNAAGTIVLIASTAGTAGNGAEPAWSSTPGVTTSDNTVTWTTIRASNYGVYAAPHPRLENAFAVNWGAAGDTFYIADDHAQTAAAAVTITSPATAALQCYVLCADKTKAPPTAAGDLKTTASITTTGTNTLQLNQGAYYYGIAFKSGSGATTTALIMSPRGSAMVFDTCALQKLGTTAANDAFRLGPATTNLGGAIVIKNTTFQFGNTGDAIQVNAAVDWTDTASAITGSIFPTTLFAKSASEIGILRVEGVDLSAIGSSTLIGTGSSTLLARFLNCKLGSGFVVGTTLVPGVIVDIINCDSGATNYQVSRVSAEGSQIVELVVVRTLGASDGTTAASWKIVTLAGTTWTRPFLSLPISIWNSVLSTNRTITLAGIWNSASLPNNDDVWIDVEYLGSAATPISTRATGTKSNYLASNAAQTADSVSAWDSAVTARANTTAYSVGNTIKTATNAGRVFFCTTAGTSAGSEPAGYASAVDGGSVTDGGAVFRAGTRFKMTVTLSSPQPAQAGYLRATISGGKASTTFWVDPLIVLG